MKIQMGEVKVNNNLSKNQRIGILILGIVIIISLFWIALNGVIKVNILKTSDTAEATIKNSSIIESKSNDEEANFNRMIVYSYEVNNKTYIGEDTLWWNIFNTDNGYKVNDKVTILYDIDNPDNSQVWHISYVFIIIAIALIWIITISIKKMKSQIQ